MKKRKEKQQPAPPAPAFPRKTWPATLLIPFSSLPSFFFFPRFSLTDLGTNPQQAHEKRTRGGKQPPSSTCEPNIDATTVRNKRRTEQSIIYRISELFWDLRFHSCPLGGQCYEVSVRNSWHGLRKRKESRSVDYGCQDRR